MKEVKTIHFERYDVRTIVDDNRSLDSDSGMMCYVGCG